MDKVNPKNHRLKLAWMEDLEIGKAPSTIDLKLAALVQYETATHWADFDSLCRDHVTQYLDFIRNTKISSKTKAAKVRHVREFFKWMVMDERLKPKQARKPILALRLTDKEQRAGHSNKRVKFATLEQIISTIEAMPKTNAIERRNRALLAFTILSGARDGAIISMTVGHVLLAEREVIQHPDTTDTKASKQINTWFFPVGKFIENEIADYISYLKNELGFTDSDPLFPATQNGHDENALFIPIGLSKFRWVKAQPMRKIFRAAFAANGMQYYNPHSFRHTLTALAYQLKLDPMAMKAWSQNLGHEHLDTTFNSYGHLSPNAQRDVMYRLSKDDTDDDAPLSRREFKEAIRKLSKGNDKTL